MIGNDWLSEAADAAEVPEAAADDDDPLPEPIDVEWRNAPE